MRAYSLIHTPIGWLGIIGHAKGVVALLRGGEKWSVLDRRLRRRYPLAAQKEVSFNRARSFLDCYFRGKRAHPPPVDLSTQTPFQRSVLRQVRRIPYGHVRSYNWLARRIRCPKGMRACGRALHQNPLPLLIPCHRIVLKSGKEGNFTWGKKMKKRLLQLESRRQGQGG